MLAILINTGITYLFAVAENPELLARGWKRQEPRRSAACEGGLCSGVISRDTPAFKPVSASFFCMILLEVYSMMSGKSEASIFNVLSYATTRSNGIPRYFAN